MDYFVLSIKLYGPALYYSTETFERLHSTVRKLFKNTNYTRPLFDLVSNARKLLIQQTQLALQQHYPLEPLVAFKAHAEFPLSKDEFTFDMIKGLKSKLRIPKDTELTITYPNRHTSFSMAKFGPNRVHSAEFIKENKAHNHSKSVVLLPTYGMAVVTSIRSFIVKTKPKGSPTVKYATTLAQLLLVRPRHDYDYLVSDDSIWWVLDVNIDGVESPKHADKIDSLVRGLVHDQLSNGDIRLCGVPQYIVSNQI